MSTFATLVRRPPTHVTAAAKARSSGRRRAPRPTARRDEPRVGSPLPQGVQAKLRVGAVDDVHEREADRVAEQVMRGGPPVVMSGTTAPRAQRTCSECEDEDAGTAQRKALTSSGAKQPVCATSGFAGGLAAARSGGGRPLPPGTQKFMQSRLGVDLGAVRVHHDSRASDLAGQIGARAFTVGNHVFFRSGEYQPGTPTGMKLIAHELAHTIQQGSSENVHRKIWVKTEDERKGEDPIDSSENDETMFGSLEVTEENRQLKLVQHYLRHFLLHPSELLGGSGRRSLVELAYNDLRRSPTLYEFHSLQELADDVLSRTIIVLLMKRSQGASSGFAYPNRGATAGIRPRVNAAATAYWEEQKGYDDKNSEDYTIDLSPVGKADAYTALTKLFTGQTSARARTLVHCDHLIGIIDLLTLAEKVGRDQFNAFVKDGSLTVRISGKAHEEVWLNPRGKHMRSRQARKHNVITMIHVAGPEEFLLGDHVVFYNHPAYPSLNAAQGAPWKLENAIVVGRQGAGELLYQGHGFDEGKTARQLIASMAAQFNKLVRQAQRLVAAGQFQALKREFPNVQPTRPGSRNPVDWEIRYIPECGPSAPANGTFKRIPLAELRTDRDYDNPFRAPCDQVIWVSRPLESAAFWDLLRLKEESDEEPIGKTR